jgi:hypothetical protein
MRAFQSQVKKTGFFQSKMTHFWKMDIPKMSKIDFSISNLEKFLSSFL